MILISQIDPGIRARSALSGIPALAEDIFTKGLISPILLTKKTPALVAEYEKEYQVHLDPNCPFLLTAGGRRISALALLGVTVLYLGTSSDVDRPGYLLREGTNVLDLLLLEGRENRNRVDLDWRDDMALIVRAYRLAKRSANAEGEYLVMKDFAAFLDVPYTDLKIAERIYDDYLSDPKSYNTATSIYGALQISLKKVASDVSKVILHRSMNEKPVIKVVGEPPPPKPQSDVITIPLSQAFFDTDPYRFLQEQPEGFCDHIVTDVRSDSLADGYRKLFYRALPPKGYLALWTYNYLLDIWKTDLENVGFSVQPYPLIWNRVDQRRTGDSNNPHSFLQSYSTCLLARKPDSILSRAQNTSVYTSGHVLNDAIYGHGTIPPEVWSWVLRGISIPGQIVYDPFARTGASAIGILSSKCRPVGTTDSLSELIKNLKSYYVKQIPNVQFT